MREGPGPSAKLLHLKHLHVIKTTRQADPDSPVPAHPLPAFSPRPSPMLAAQHDTSWELVDTERVLYLKKTELFLNEVPVKCLFRTKPEQSPCQAWSVPRSLGHSDCHTQPGRDGSPES